MTLPGSILAKPSGLPVLEGVVDIPTLRSDGSAITTPGYDEPSHLYYHPGGQAPAVPDNPSHGQVEDALRVIMEPFAKFPFVGDQDRVNYLATLITSLVRPIIAGNVPLTVVTSPIQGSGKTKLGSCVGMVISGARNHLMTAPDRGSDEEMRKRLTAKLRKRPPVVVIDNVVGVLNSPSLAAALTAGT